jgi:hypothetical protein
MSDTAAGDCSRREAQRECERARGGAGGKNLESSFSTLTAKTPSTERPTKYLWCTQNVRASGEHGLLYRPGSLANGISLPEVQEWRSAILDCNLRLDDNQYMEEEKDWVGVISGCVKSERAKGALRGAIGVKNGVKSGGFRQPLS